MFPKIAVWQRAAVRILSWSAAAVRGLWDSGGGAAALHIDVQFGFGERNRYDDVAVRFDDAVRSDVAAEGEQFLAELAAEECRDAGDSGVGGGGDRGARGDQGAEMRRRHVGLVAG